MEMSLHVYSPVSHAAPIDIDQNCDLCDSPFSEGGHTYLGMATSGALVTVSECCKPFLERLYSHRTFKAHNSVSQNS